MNTRLEWKPWENSGSVEQAVLVHPKHGEIIFWYECFGNCNLRGRHRISIQCSSELLDEADHLFRHYFDRDVAFQEAQYWASILMEEQ